MTAAAHDWLDMRSPFDDAAREHALPLLDRVAEGLADGAGAGRDSRADADSLSRAGAGRDSRPEAVTVIDIGAGTGNSASWFDRHLGPRLGDGELRWILLDADEDSLRAASSLMPEATTVTAPITRLPEIAAEHLPGETAESASGQLLVTCSAVFDVLAPADVEAVAETLARFGGMGLFLLSVTGEWSLSPVDPRDDEIARAFAAHQERDGKLGADGGAALIAAAERIGAEVINSASPWHLSAPRDSAFISRFLTERVEAAVEEVPELHDVASAWLEERKRQADSDLSVTVDHLDVFVDARSLR